MVQEALKLHPGQKLGRYELLAKAAGSGSGLVWVARLRGARGFHKLIAIKALTRSVSAGREQRLIEQARISAWIQHSNVVQTLELAEDDGRIYLVMEWVDGEPLHDVCVSSAAGGGVPLLIAVNWLSQMLRGLQAAHELRDERGSPLGLVHGALCPSNLLVSYSGTIKIANFAQSHAEGEATNVADNAERYFSPEQIAGAALDRRSDLFAAGVLLYELTTGRHPFEGRSAADPETVLRPSLFVPNYSRTLEAVVMKALERKAERRWPSAEEMRLALQRGIPQAFELGFDPQLRNFMADSFGDRAARKRELLHRAGRVVDRGSDGPPAPSSISASSLRALAIDTRKGDRSDPPAVRPVPPLRPLLARSIPQPHLRRRLLLAVALLAGLAYGVLRLNSAPSSSHRTAASNSGMVELVPPRAPKALPSAAVALSSASGSAANLSSARPAPQGPRRKPTPRAPLSR